MRTIIVLLFLFSTLGTTAQDTTKKAIFALAKVKMWSNFGSTKQYVDCRVQYSNGPIVEITKILHLDPMNYDYDQEYNDSIVHQDEFKILSYFYDKGYELLPLTFGNTPAKYYFKLKE